MTQSRNIQRRTRLYDQSLHKNAQTNFRFYLEPAELYSEFFCKLIEHDHGQLCEPSIVKNRKLTRGSSFKMAFLRIFVH